MSREGVSKREDQFEQYFKSQKIRKAFIVGNSYNGTLKCNNDAIKFAEILERKCGFKKTYNSNDRSEDYYFDNCNNIENPLNDNLVVLTNTSKLLSIFKKYLETFKYSETSIEFIFYFSGHGIVNENEGLKILMEDNKTLELEKIVKELEEKEKQISEECQKKLQLTSSFRKLFILDCCRNMEESKQDAINKIFKEPSYPFKEHKNTAFLYSSNLGFPAFTFLNPFFNQEFDNPHGLSVLTSSLIQRINSIRAPNRNLTKAVSIIQKDLLERYIAYKSYNKVSQKSIVVDENSLSNNNNYNSIQIDDEDVLSKKLGNDQNVLDYKNQILETLKVERKANINNLLTYEVFEKIVQDKFNILYGDITVGKFIFVEGPELETSKDKEILDLKKLIEIQKKEIEDQKKEIEKLKSLNNTGDKMMMD